MAQWRRLLAVVLMLIGSPAMATWYEAHTAHFVLTIDDTEAGARDFAARLERFDAALRRLYGLPDNPEQRLRPVAIFEFKPDLFTQTCGCPGVLGFYRPNVAGSFILAAHMPDMDRKTRTGWWSSQVLVLHEYGHHFSMSNYPIAYPMWFQEGFAEFNANASFEPDGSIIIGYPADYRTEGLRHGDRLSPKQLFAPLQYGDGGDPELVYERGWLLTHYILLNPARRPQLNRYLTAMNNGQDSVGAAQAAFGDLKKLDAELEAYRRGKLGAPFRVPPTDAKIDVKLRALSAGEAAMLPLHVRTMRGIAKDYALGPTQQARRIAARFPTEAVVQEQWSDTALAAGRLDEADQAADRALALSPRYIEALDRKGLIAVRRLRAAKSIDAGSWTAARAWYLKANHLDANAVEPLSLYYDSFVAAKATPTAGAINGLRRAAVLAPESTNVRWALARQDLAEGNAQEARALLQPMAYAPHHAIDTNLAAKVIALLDAGKLAEARAAISPDKKDG